MSLSRYAKKRRKSGLNRQHIYQTHSKSVDCRYGYATTITETRKTSN